MDKPTISLIRSKCFVDGQWIGEGKLPVTNKATGDVITRVPEFAKAKPVARSKPRTGLPGWSKLLAKDRSKIIRAWYNLIARTRRRAGALTHQRAGQAAG